MSSEETQTLIERPILSLEDRHVLIGLGPTGMITIELPVEGALVIGRGTEPGVVDLKDPTASRRHAEVVVRKHEIVVRDLGSQNGTRVRGGQLTSECTLYSGDLIEIGATSLFLHSSQDLVAGRSPTGHVMFERRLQEEMGKARHQKHVLGLLMVDSHQLSSALGPVIRNFMRPGDAVEEYGAGQYEVLFICATVDLAEKVAARLHQALKEGAIQASLGLAVFPRDGTSPDELFMASRRSMRAASQAAGIPGQTVEAESALPRASIVRSPLMLAIYDTIEQVGPGNISVLITGETGSGKELLAAAIHQRSQRRAAHFVRINCSALNEQLLEAELFGYMKGAFTGAFKDKLGLFEHAHGGTMLLDEVGEMPAALQAKLLNVLEDKEVRRVGGLEARPVDVRIVAATNRDLPRMVEDGTFRNDLYWRLCGISIAVPPLRDRPEEIPALAQHFLERYAREISRATPVLTDEISSRLCAYSWPGNVRQLRNVMERVVLLARDGTINPAHLPEGIAGRMSSNPGTGAQATAPLPSVPAPAWPTTEGDLPVSVELEAIERQKILNALEKAGQNQTVAARLLGMPRRTFVTKLDRYNIARPRKNRLSREDV